MLVDLRLRLICNLLSTVASIDLRQNRNSRIVLFKCGTSSGAGKIKSIAPMIPTAFF
jgi:hypothetical protein